MTQITGAPLSFQAADVETLEQLEFAAALDIVAQCAVSSSGARRVRMRLPSASREWVERELYLVDGLLTALQEGDRFRPVVLPDVEDIIERLGVAGSALDGSELVALARAAEGMREVASELGRLSREDDRFEAMVADVPPEDLAKRIDRALDPDGTVKDGASPDLRRARSAVRSTRERLVKMLESATRDLPSRDLAPDVSVTVRNGRYVIPVKREARSRLSGIVHSESGSGATIFVEPTAAVELGNELQSCQAAEVRAVQQVLRELTSLARGWAGALADGWEMCVAADDLYARARYACDLGAAVPDLGEAETEVKLNQARHPILCSELVDVVPFDLTVDADVRVIVVSGPNTGGKTVLLKAVGLIAALTQAGVVAPVAAGSRLPVFDRIFADIGDRQSIVASLSTFSGHLSALKSIIEHATRQSLILLDEFGTGTDPVEGAALAGAVLQSLSRRGALTMATTHLGQIKQLAAKTPGAVNASLQFDPDALRPTYRFLPGVPGRSYGLAIAERLGFPPAVLEGARDLQPEAERSLDALLAGLEGREQELARREEDVAAESSRIAAERDGLQALRSELTERAATLEEERRQLETTGRAEARQFLLSARKRVDEALGVARGAVDEVTAKKARRLVEAGVREEADALKKLEEHAKQKGWTVRLASGERVSPKMSGTPPVTKVRPTRRRKGDRVVAEAPAVTEIDLRGMTGDEAEEAVLRALDTAVVEDLPVLRIIHGKGTGALRQRVGDVLRRDRRVGNFAPAVPAEGGWGVTIAEMKS